jgi:hypothetical protein
LKITLEVAHNLLLSKGFTVYDYNKNYSSVYYAFGDIGFCLFLLNDIKHNEIERISYYEMTPVNDSNVVSFRRCRRIDEYNPTKKSIVKGLKKYIPMLYEASKLGKEMRIKIKIDEISEDFK